jgi:hypothetical protein
MKITEHISDAELADYCEKDGWPFVGEQLAAGMTQQEATAYLIGEAPMFSDGEARWLQDYLEFLHGPAVRHYRYYEGVR